MTKGRIKGGARLRDVAAAAGVSNATVSAVVNGRAEQYGICRATQAKVQAAVRQLGYTPSLAALDMVSGRNSLVGLALSSDFPAAGRLIAALEPALSLAGHRLIVICLPTDPQVAAARISELIRFGIAGLVLFPACATALSGLNCPSVMIGGLPADTDPAAVVELGQTAARLLQQAIQGATTETIRLDPVIAPRVPVTPITPEPPVPVAAPAKPVPPVVQPPKPVPVPVVVPVPVPGPVPVPVPQAPPPAVPVVPVQPVENPVVEIQPESPIQSSETFQMPETPVLDVAEPPPEAVQNLPVAEPIQTTTEPDLPPVVEPPATVEPISSVVAAVPGGTEPELSIPVTEPIPAVDPVPDPVPVPQTPEAPPVAEVPDVTEPPVIVPEPEPTGVAAAPEPELPVPVIEPVIEQIPIPEPEPAIEPGVTSEPQAVEEPVPPVLC
jgi:hypothetical protein